MNRKRKTKLLTIFSILILFSVATALILYALKQNINLFFTPTELHSAKIDPKQLIRLGGYVKKGSVHYDANGDMVQFIVTDRFHEIRVTFTGVLPNLFREGQTVVVTGKLDTSQHIAASNVLAKHDEKYMPLVLKNKL